MGASGTVLTSADGTSWHAEPSLGAFTFKALATDSVNAIGVAAGTHGKIYNFYRY